jgi:hypothetical protein
MMSLIGQHVIISASSKSGNAERKSFRENGIFKTSMKDVIPLMDWLPYRQIKKDRNPLPRIPADLPGL